MTQATHEILAQGFGSLKDDNVLLEILYRGETMTISKDMLPFKLGRDELSDITIPAIVASRRHCQICIEDGRLGIVDSSTNGTYIKIGQAGEIHIIKEFFPILGKGMIKLGEPVGSGEKNLIFFKCAEID